MGIHNFASGLCFRTIFIQYTSTFDIVFKTPTNITFDGYADDNTPYTYSSKVEKKMCWTIYKGQ